MHDRFSRNHEFRLAHGFQNERVHNDITGNVVELMSQLFPSRTVSQYAMHDLMKQNKLQFIVVQGVCEGRVKNDVFHVCAGGPAA